jgi:hypothetical protein
MSIRTIQPATIISLIILIVITAGLGFFSFYHSNFVAPVNQAEYFDDFIETSTSDLFVKEISDDSIRLVDKDLAEALVNKHTSIFGSNIILVSLHVTTYEGRLVWVAEMAPDNFFNQELSGLIIIDANDPTMVPKKIEFSSGTATISENLFYGADTKRVAWLNNKWLSYGRTYITWAPDDITHPDILPGQVVQIQTYNSPQLFQYITHFGGVQIYDLKGKLLETYDKLAEIPSWISQPFSEQWLEDNIRNWGSLRSGSGFDRFASGFLGIKTPSPDRLEISQDTRYILSPDTNETIAITPVHPSTSHLSNAGVFLSNAEGITYFDYHQRNYTSAAAVEQLVESLEPPPAQGNYYATLPMLYPMKIGNETRLAWFCPVYHAIYSTSTEGTYVTNVNFRGLYILDAKYETIYGRAYLAGSASAMVASAKNEYRQKVIEIIGVTPTEPNQTIDDFIYASITDRAEYVENGNSYILFRTNRTDYQLLLASPETLTRTEWFFALLDVNIGTIIKFKATQENNYWTLTTISQG